VRLRLRSLDRSLRARSGQALEAVGRAEQAVSHLRAAEETFAELGIRLTRWQATV